MSVKHVKIYYGPCETISRIKEYIPCKFSGMRSINFINCTVVDRLRRHGYRVDLIPVDFVNYCMLEMCGFEIFRCNQKYIGYNLPYQRDEICRRAVHATMDASEKFQRARDYLYTWMQLDHQMFKRSEFASKDYWAFEVDLEPIEACIGCEDCNKYIKERLQPLVDEDKRKMEEELYVREGVLKPYEEQLIGRREKVQL